jgi:hypothetical protein
MSLRSLRMIYFAYIHPITAYGIIFWGNSPYTIKPSRIQKDLMRIMMDLKANDSCRESFKEIKILPLCCQYTYSLIQFVVNNKDLFTRNTEVHNKGTRQNISLFRQPFTKET